ncbi:spore coat protein [Clostridium mediterraneense]|uniref:spore coat protein n=1 Tax=Clostridium mediterraneense TaxID=1805472 RepID=UPI00082A75A0|nr:spore coat protein [Clostridium mediterraneense]
MQEKEMISDYLSSINASLAGYGATIAQTENRELRQTLQDMRNQDEIRQYNLFKKAKEKGYYKPAEPATQDEISSIKQEFSQEQQ